MPADLPPGTTRYVINEGERFPTLDVDDCSWRGSEPGSEPAGHYPDERTVVLPDVVYDMWREARDRLRIVEHMILEIEEVQIRFDHGTLDAKLRQDGHHPRTRYSLPDPGGL